MFFRLFVALTATENQAAHERGSKEDFLKELKDVSDQLDVDDVQWLLQFCSVEAAGRNDSSEPHIFTQICAECLRVIIAWANNLVANVPAPGEEIPLRFDMIENAVTLLLDEAVQDRTVQERVQFLIDKGVTISEIKYACKQAGLEFPQEMDITADGLDSDGDRVELINTGANFLVNDTVRKKPLDEKIVFLKRKGLNDSEIRKACTKV